MSVLAITDTDVAIVGAGAAGLAAARTLTDLGVPFVMLEASHRIGGRAYTEDVLPGVPFDLGCHWMHSASLNPYVAIADSFGFHYNTQDYPRRTHLDGAWVNETIQEDRAAFFHRNLDLINQVGKRDLDVSVAEAIECNGRWTTSFNYFISCSTSAEADQVSVFDYCNYNDTGENWPIKEGFGALVARFGEDLPVTLNTAVECINWSGSDLCLITSRGELHAKKVIITVSTEILAGGYIRFNPSLPESKQEAIAALPLGNHNRICLVYDCDVFGDDFPPVATLLNQGSEPMGFVIQPFGYNYVVGYTGGRFADWLERAGEAEAINLAKENLKKAFGADIIKHIVGHNVTAWRSDPWIRGAYSVALPGQSHQRSCLAEPLDERLYFAGEAASLDFFSTVHGAHLTGINAAQAVAKSLI